MEDFGDRNEKVLEMWSSVKSNQISPVVYAVIALILVLIAALIIFSVQMRKNKRRRRRG